VALGFYPQKIKNVREKESVEQCHMVQVPTTQGKISRVNSQLTFWHIIPEKNSKFSVFLREFFSLFLSFSVFLYCFLLFPHDKNIELNSTLAFS
jgi:hypothetical protein